MFIVVFVFISVCITLCYDPIPCQSDFLAHRIFGVFGIEFVQVAREHFKSTTVHFLNLLDSHTHYSDKCTKQPNDTCANEHSEQKQQRKKKQNQRNNSTYISLKHRCFFFFFCLRLICAHAFAISKMTSVWFIHYMNGATVIWHLTVHLFFLVRLVICDVCGLVSMPIVIEMLRHGIDVIKNVIFSNHTTTKAKQLNHTCEHDGNNFDLIIVWFDLCFLKNKKTKFSAHEEGTKDDSTKRISMVFSFFCFTFSCFIYHVFWWKCVNLDAKMIRFNGNFLAVNYHLLIDTLNAYLNGPRKSIRINSSERA